MLVASETKNKDQFVHGSLRCPTATNPLYDAWRRCNLMVMSWLTRSMNPAIKQSVLWMDIASEIWTDMKERFSHANKFRIADLQDQIQNYKQGDSTISEYYTRLKILWKEIEIYRCVVLYNCTSKCSCDLIPKLQRERKDDYVIRFLRGLNDEYSQVRSQVMIMDPMPSIVKTFSMILQHEREFVGNLPSSVSQDSIAFSFQSTDSSKHYTFTKPNTGMSKNSNLGKSSHKNTKFCEKCKKTNHTIETCYWRTGFPAGYQKSGRTNSSATIASASLAEVAPNTPSQPANLVEESSHDQFSFSKD